MATKLGNGKSFLLPKILLFFLSLPFASACRVAAANAAGGGGDGSSTQELDVQKHLKNLNRPAVKSIKSPDGDIIDCVHISKQPALDHPDLKNHKIQMRPNFVPLEGRILGETKMSSSSSSRSKGNFTQLWHQSGKCPEGTIPIRRTREEDILRANSVQQFGKKKQKTIPQPQPQPGLLCTTHNNHEHSIAYVTGDKYYGTKATINVWKPKVEEIDGFSLSQMWILGGNFDKDLNTIEAGWQVNLKLYGDDNTRFFIYWTSDSYQSTGCYNLLCSGFVQVSREIALGATISPLSSYDGSQYDITILVWKDPKEGHWWMQYGNEHIVGYWPSTLFSYLSESASSIEWGGEVVNSQFDHGQHTTNQMGSGHFPEEGFKKASFFKNIQVVDNTNKLQSPSDIQDFSDKSSCYNVHTDSSDKWGSYFYYGGPGRNLDCP